MRKYIYGFLIAWNNVKKYLKPKCDVCEAIKRNALSYQPPLITVRRKKDRLYFALNLDPVGYWTEKELHDFENFVRQFNNGVFEEIVFPRLRFDAPEGEE